MGRLSVRAGAGRTPGSRAPASRRIRRRALEGDLALGCPRRSVTFGSEFGNRRRVRRLFDVRLLPDRQAFDPLAGFLQFSLAELQVLAPAGDRRDRLFQAQLALLEGASTCSSASENWR